MANAVAGVLVAVLGRAKRGVDWEDLYGERGIFAEYRRAPTSVA